MDISNLDKHVAILKAAMELIADNGFHGSPISMIANRAGVGAGTIYRYFENKDVLIREVFDEIETRLNQTLDGDYPTDQSIKRRLDHYYIGLVHFFFGHPVEFKFLGQFYDSPYGVEIRRDKIFNQTGREHSRETLKSLFEQGIARGVIKDLPMVFLFAFFIGSIIALTRDHILGFIELDNRLLQQAADTCWDAIKA
ncbi:MAG: TetR/AcrR family transcriptional regulator [Proteobacteria bacterium]|nr:TetR/AcrR family transcriptional regulator [Pseudomonadota bacterium]